MTTGTGLFLLGTWLSLAAAYAAPSITATGLSQAKTTTWIATIIGVIVTAISYM